MSSPDIIIREATKGDLEGVVDLWHEMMDWHAALDPRLVLAEGAEKVWRRWARRHIRSKESCILVAEATAAGDGAAAGELVGMCMGSVRELPPVFVETRVGFISDLVVRAAQRRKGTGTRLAREMLARLRSQGFGTVELNVAAMNPAAQSFWRSLGASDHHSVMRIEP